MDLINISLIVAVGITFFLGVSIFFHRKEGHRFAISFSLLSITMAIWSVFMILYRLLDDPGHVLISAKILYAIPIFIPILFLFFVFAFCGVLFWKQRKNTIIAILTSIGIVGVLITLSTDFIVTSVNINVISEREVYFGFLYPIYITYYLSLFGVAYITLFMTHIRSVSKKRRGQIEVIFLGTLTTTSFGLTTDLVLPWFGFFTTNWLANFTSIFFVGSILYGIIRYNLFNIKIILTEILVVVIWSLLAVEVFSVQTQIEFAVKLVIFGSVIFLSIFLVRSVYREVEQREEIERLAEDLRKANIRLKELDTLKSQFLSIASHDLRAPLTAIRNFMSILLDGTYGKLPSAAEEGTQQVFERATDMAEMVDNYLNVSRIEQGRMKYDFEDIDFAEVLNETVKSFEPVAKEKDLSIEFSPVVGALPMKADESKLREVVENLLNNAINYTLKGSITITAEKVGNMVQITFQDTGIGMSPKTITSLFGLFSQGEDSRKYNPKSTGVGLYITKAHVEAHKGTIRAESDGEGKGSRIIIELPLSV